MTRTRGIEQVAADHRIELDAAQRDAVIGQHNYVELQVVADLPHRRILEQWPEPFEYGRAADLDGWSCRIEQVASRLAAFVPDRHIACLSCPVRERHADDGRAHG